MSKGILVAVLTLFLVLSLYLSAPAATGGGAKKRPSSPPAASFGTEETAGPYDSSASHGHGIAGVDPPTARGKSSGMAPADITVLNSPPAVPKSPPGPGAGPTQRPSAENAKSTKDKQRAQDDKREAVSDMPSSPNQAIDLAFGRTIAAMTVYQGGLGGAPVRQGGGSSPQAAAAAAKTPAIEGGGFVGAAPVQPVTTATAKGAVSPPKAVSLPPQQNEKTGAATPDARMVGQGVGDRPAQAAPGPTASNSASVSHEPAQQGSRNANVSTAAKSDKGKNLTASMETTNSGAVTDNHELGAKVVLWTCISIALLLGLGYVGYLAFEWWLARRAVKAWNQMPLQQPKHAATEIVAIEYSAEKQTQESRPEARTTAKKDPRKSAAKTPPASLRPESQMIIVDPYDLSKRLEKVESDIIRMHNQNKSVSGAKPHEDSRTEMDSLCQRVADLEAQIRRIKSSGDGQKRSASAPDEMPPAKEPTIADRMDSNTLKALDGMLAVARGTLEAEARKDWANATETWNSRSASLVAKASAIRQFTTGVLAVFSSQAFAGLMDPAEAMTPALRTFCDDMKQRLKEIERGTPSETSPPDPAKPSLSYMTPEEFYRDQLKKDPSVTPDRVRDAYHAELDARIAEAKMAFQARVQELLPEVNSAEILQQYDDVLKDRIPRLIDQLEAIEKKQVDSGKGDSPIRRGCVEVIDGVLAAAGFEQIQVKEGEYPNLSLHDVATSGEPVSNKSLEGKIVRVFRRGYRMGKDVIKRPMVVIGAPDVGRSPVDGSGQAVGTRKTS